MGIYIWIWFGKSTWCGEKDEEKRVNSGGGERRIMRGGKVIMNHKIKIKKNHFESIQVEFCKVNRSVEWK
jgi:hypothetical protein